MLLAKLIAPCGMNCGLCRSYLKEEKNCPGCRGGNVNKPPHCVQCAIKSCPRQKRFCFTCEIFPCARLKHLDERYRTKYGMSMIENQEMIKDVGVCEFVKREQVRWACPGCGKTLCVHRDACLYCGKKR